MATGPANRRSMPSARRVSAAGVMTGCSISTSELFRHIDWELMISAVRHHTDCPWVLLYIERWLKAPVQLEDGSVVLRDIRNSSGRGCQSRILAKSVSALCVRHVDEENHPHIQFERYADDAICHCRSEEQARTVQASLATRFAACRLVLHPEKTKLVYCKDEPTWRLPGPIVRFSRFKFRRRLSRKGMVSASRSGPPPARRHSRRSARQSDDGHFISAVTSPCRTWPTCSTIHIRGWINYYGQFYKSALYPALRHIDRILARWVHRKFKSLRRHKRRTHHWLAHVVRRQPDLFAHWSLLYGRGRTMGAG